MTCAGRKADAPQLATSTPARFPDSWQASPRGRSRPDPRPRRCYACLSLVPTLALLLGAAHAHAARLDTPGNIVFEVGNQTTAAYWDRAPDSNQTALQYRTAEVGIPLQEGAISPLRPRAVPEVERKLKLGPTARRTALHIRLPRASRAERAYAARALGRGPVAVAFHREMPEQFQGNLSSRLNWTRLDHRSIATTILVTSPGATDVRMGVLVDLPPGGELRFFGAGERFPVVTRADLAWKGSDPRTLWSPVVEGDTLGIEITLPSRAALSAFSFRVDRISHGYGTERTFESGHVHPAQQCLGHLLDYQCGVGLHFPARRGDSAARLRYEVSGRGYACSGTLVNDSDDTSFIPYVLTANHCISTPDVAATLSIRWFYQRSACGGTTLDSRSTTTSGGADLLATSATEDSTLLRIKGSVPGGLWYSGWNPNRITHPRNVYLIHHPAGGGGVRRYSVGRTTRYLNWLGCADPVRGIRCVPRRGMETAWSEGTTSDGSSGAGLFDGQHLIGVHSGRAGQGGSLCALGSGYAGAFSNFFPQIRRWLEASAPRHHRHHHRRLLRLLRLRATRA